MSTPVEPTLHPVGAWGGFAFMRSGTRETCPERPYLTMTNGDFSTSWLQVPAQGIVLAADFPIEQWVGYVVTDCNGDIELHRFENGSSGEIISQPEDLPNASFPTDRNSVAEIGWETFTTIRLGDQIIDLRSGDVTPLESDDPSVRTIGKTQPAVDAPFFRYVVERPDAGDCDSAPLVVENRHTGERLPALQAYDVVGTFDTFRSISVAGRAAWTMSCGFTSTLHAARIDPANGTLLDHVELARVDNDTITFTLHVHGELKAWSDTDLATGIITPLLQIDLAPDRP